jgi:hypothetical protein
MCRRSQCEFNVRRVPRPTSQCGRGKPAIVLSMEGSPHAPALVFETRGCATGAQPLLHVCVTLCRFDPASGNVEIRVGGEKVMQTQQPDGDAPAPRAPCAARGFLELSSHAVIHVPLFIEYSLCNR